MKTTLLVCIVLLFSSLAFAQNRFVSPSQSIAVNGGISKLGTGDIWGVTFGVAYEKKFRSRISWIAELGSTIHDGSDLLLVTIDTGETYDLSYRYTTAAMQLAGKLGYDFIASSNIDFGLRIGALLRYQTSSLADIHEIYFPVITNLPIPVSVTRHFEPQRILSLGGQGQVFLNYNVSRTMTVGAATGLQMDTNGDTMFPMFSVSVGRRF